MDVYVVDTHTLFWYLTSDSRLTGRAAEITARADRGAALLIVPIIVLAEFYSVRQKVGSGPSFPEIISMLVQGAQFEFASSTLDDVEQFDDLSGISDIHDRMIAAMARRLGCPLLTRDAVLSQSDLVDTIWD